MFRTVLLMLIATMLACPLRCSAHAAGGCGEAEAAQLNSASGCKCCQPAASEVPGALPAEGSPAQGCECGNCICNGAVLESDVQFVFTAVLAVAAELPGLEREPVAPRADVACVDGLSSPHDIYPSGRAARIAHQSLLI